MGTGSSATSSTEPRKTVVWIERLTVPTLIGLWIESRFLPRDIRYDEHRVTVAAGRILDRLAGAGLASCFHPAGLTLAAKDAAGLALNYRREEELDRLCESFCARHLQNRPLRYRRAVKSYLCDALMWKATFIVMVEAAAAAIPAADHVLHLARHPANDLVIGHDAWPGFHWRESLSPRGILRIAGAPSILFARMLLTFLRGPAVAPGLARIRPAVWVEYYEANLGSVSWTFWRSKVDASSFDLVYYLDRRDSECDSRTTSAIEAQGFRWVDGHTPWRLARPTPHDFLDALRALRSAGPRAPLWLRLFDLEFVLLTRMWGAVFARFQTRLLIQHQEFSWRQAPQAQGLERAGGRMIGFHWSEFQFLTEPIHLNPEHLFFVWGRNHHRWLEGKGHDCLNILPCGLWILPQDSVTQSIRGRLAGMRFTLALFDSSHDYNIFLSAGQLSEFLLAMLSLLEEQPLWKAVLKPKSLDGYARLPRGQEILTRIDLLSKGGRLLLLEPGVTPMTAALAADLSVCFGLNSAGVVSGAFGARAVHWDCSGWGLHPLYADPAQRLVYQTLPLLKEAILAAAGGDKTIGDFSRWRAMINHFDDRHADRRVGRWIMSYMAKLERGLPAEDAMREAVAEYRAEHGIDDSFFRQGSWWNAKSASEVAAR
ncbi:MAG: hypothetical protein NDJ72_01250 [Elusimicrobia bacterium]|nr:hypothetical protein [Elusimicrobiota bacterium]